MILREKWPSLTKWRIPTPYWKMTMPNWVIMLYWETSDYPLLRDKWQFFGKGQMTAPYWGTDYTLLGDKWQPLICLYPSLLQTKFIPISFTEWKLITVSTAYYHIIQELLKGWSITRWYSQQWLQSHKQVLKKGGSTDYWHIDYSIECPPINRCQKGWSIPYWQMTPLIEKQIVPSPYWAPQGHPFSSQK